MSIQLQPCKYGEKCYRKNLEHRQKFWHPVLNPTDKKVCDYGEKCFRKPQPSSVNPLPAVPPTYNQQKVQKKFNAIGGFDRVLAIVQYLNENKQQTEKKELITKLRDINTTFKLFDGEILGDVSFGRKTVQRSQPTEVENLKNFLGGADVYRRAEELERFLDQSKTKNSLVKMDFEATHGGVDGFIKLLEQLHNLNGKKEVDQLVKNLREVNKINELFDKEEAYPKILDAQNPLLKTPVLLEFLEKHTPKGVEMCYGCLKTGYFGLVQLTDFTKQEIVDVSNELLVVDMANAQKFLEEHRLFCQSQGVLGEVKQRYTVFGSPNEGFVQIGDDIRFRISEETAKLRNTFGGPNEAFLKNVRLFIDGSNSLNGKTKNLLGNNICVVPGRMDYDENWNPLTGPQTQFWVGHQAAPNIGETNHSPGFKKYEKANSKDKSHPNGRLDEAKYLNDLKLQEANSFKAAEHLGAQHFVTFPFGRGAFHNHLWEMDPDYGDPQKLFNLKYQSAYKFLEACESSKIPDIHLCLPTGNNPNSNCNYDAYLKALADYKTKNPKSSVPQRLKLHINKDATALAQKLANQHGDGQVYLVNGANQELLGNHWDGTGARTAIDENMHRRSSQIAWFSACLNGLKYNPQKGQFAKQLPTYRTPDELKYRVHSFDGMVYDLNNNCAVKPKPPQPSQPPAQQGGGVFGWLFGQ